MGGMTGRSEERGGKVEGRGGDGEMGVSRVLG